MGLGRGYIARETAQGAVNVVPAGSARVRHTARRRSFPSLDLASVLGLPSRRWAAVGVDDSRSVDQGVGVREVLTFCWGWGSGWWGERGRCVVDVPRDEDFHHDNGGF